MKFFDVLRARWGKGTRSVFRRLRARRVDRKFQQVMNCREYGWSNVFEDINDVLVLFDLSKRIENSHKAWYRECIERINDRCSDLMRGYSERRAIAVIFRVFAEIADDDGWTWREQGALALFSERKWSTKVLIALAKRPPFTWVVGHSFPNTIRCEAIRQLGSTEQEALLLRLAMSSEDVAETAFEALAKQNRGTRDDLFLQIVRGAAKHLVRSLAVQRLDVSAQQSLLLRMALSDDDEGIGVSACSRLAEGDAFDDLVGDIAEGSRHERVRERAIGRIASWRMPMADQRMQIRGKLRGQIEAWEAAERAHQEAERAKEYCSRCGMWKCPGCGPS